MKPDIATETLKGGSDVFPATPNEAQKREAQAREARINRFLDAAETERRNGGDAHTILEIVRDLQKQGASGANAQRREYIPPKPGKYVGTETEESAQGKPDPQSRFLPVGSSQPSGGEADLTKQAKVEIPNVEKDITDVIVFGKNHKRIKGTILGIQPVLGWAIADAFGWLAKKMGIPRLIITTHNAAQYISTAYREGLRLREEKEDRKKAEKAAKKHKQTVQKATQAAPITEQQQPTSQAATTEVPVSAPTTADTTEKLAAIPVSPETSQELQHTQGGIDLVKETQTTDQQKT